MANFDALYMIPPGFLAVRPDMEPMLTIVPLRFFRKWGIAA